MSHLSELEIIHTIQEWRSPALDIFFKCLNYFDRPEFFFVLIPAVWVGKDWKAGIKLFYILVLSSFTNHLLKVLFAFPRPLDLDPSVAVIHLGSYGLPSGAAQTTILLSGLLINYWKSAWKWPIAICYIILISFSRLYLGVHFPTDILGGWIVGFLLWALFTYSIGPIENRLKTYKPQTLFWLSLAVPLIWIFCYPYSPVPRMAACAMGLGIGLFINAQKRWNLPSCRTKSEFLWRALIGVLGTFLLYYLMKYLHIPSFFLFLFLGLWIATASAKVVHFLGAKNHPDWHQ